MVFGIFGMWGLSLTLYSVLIGVRLYSDFLRTVLNIMLSISFKLKNLITISNLNKIYWLNGNSKEHIKLWWIMWEIQQNREFSLVFLLMYKYFTRRLFTSRVKVKNVRQGHDAYSTSNGKCKESLYNWFVLYQWRVDSMVRWSTSDPVFLDILYHGRDFFKC